VVHVLGDVEVDRSIDLNMSSKPEGGSQPKGFVGGRHELYGLIAARLAVLLDLQASAGPMYRERDEQVQR
jgi:hypothetical protein